jgi:DNA-binding NarL/FixJ family response regulator
MAARTRIREQGLEDGRRTGDVVLLDEHPLWLDALERVLTTVGVNVVAKSTSPEAVLQVICSEQPDALVASMELPTSDMDGIECIRRALERAPQLRVVALSTYHDAFHLTAAAAAGAHAYLPKTADPAELVSTVLECLARKRDGRARRLKALPEGPGLTARELEILYLVARGCTNPEIAERLWVTKWTVKFHLANAYRKLGVSNRTQASRYAFRFLEPEAPTADAVFLAA